MGHDGKLRGRGSGGDNGETDDQRRQADVVADGSRASYRQVSGNEQACQSDEIADAMTEKPDSSVRGPIAARVLLINGIV